jgi:uncharacterized protein
MEVTPAKLAQIDRAEDSLRALGYRQLRVRHHGELARVELAREEMPRALSPDALREISAASTQDFAGSPRPQGYAPAP